MKLGFALGAIALVVAAGCTIGKDGTGRASSVGEAPFEQTVAISGGRYHPTRTTILVGGNVTWVNRDRDMEHGAETLSPRYREMTGGERGAFDTDSLTRDEPYTVAFHKPGTYRYYCPFDARMEGEVAVVIKEPPR